MSDDNEETADQVKRSDNGKVSGPSSLTEEKKYGFLSIQTGLSSNATTDIDEAIKVPTTDIERAFVNRWDRHLNVEINRSHDVLRRQAYDLSFGDDEKERIRDSLPSDSKVLDLIECFGTDILLRNFSHYLGRRRKYFRWVSFIAAPLSWLIALALAVRVAPSLVSLEPSSSTVGKFVQTIAPAVLFIVFFSLAGLFSMRFLWGWLIADKLKKEKDYYKEVVEGSASRVKNYLNSVQDSFVSLSVSAQQQLTDIKERGEDFVKSAVQYVRLIVWFPVRFSMIEVFYRATIDSYMELSAKEVLAADLRIFAWRQLRWFAMLTVAATSILAFVPGPAAMAPVAISIAGLIAVLWPQREAWSSARYIPEQFSGFQFEVFRRRAWGVFIGSVPAAIGAFLGHMRGSSWLSGLVPDAPQLQAAYHVFFDSPRSGVILSNAMIAGVCYLQNIVAWQIYLRTKTRVLYNANIVDTIKKEMDSVNWKKFDELRSDQKMASIYESVFTALQKERNRRQ
ncbi:MAG: hypothetical protein WAW96_14790 [Alphaproteobacteria bacterium]